MYYYGYCTILRYNIGSCAFFLTEHLGLMKACSRWLPHQLTKEQKAYRVKCARELLKTYKICPKKKSNELLTGNET